MRVLSFSYFSLVSNVTCAVTPSLMKGGNDRPPILTPMPHFSVIFLQRSQHHQKSVSFSIYFLSLTTRSLVLFMKVLLIFFFLLYHHSEYNAWHMHSRFLIVDVAWMDHILTLKLCGTTHLSIGLFVCLFHGSTQLKVILLYKCALQM